MTSTRGVCWPCLSFVAVCCLLFVACCWFMMSVLSVSSSAQEVVVTSDQDQSKWEEDAEMIRNLTRRSSLFKRTSSSSSSCFHLRALRPLISLRPRRFSSAPYEEFYRDGVDPSTPRKMYLTSDISEDDPNSHEIYRYEVDFVAECDDVQFTQEGGFIEISESDMKSIFPTGMAGEYEENAFMVRDSGKLLCRILEDFEHRCKLSTGASTPEVGHRFPVVLPDLTDLPQWDNSGTGVYSYGNENLNSDLRKPMTTDGENMIVRGEGSTVENVVKALKEKNKGNLPSRMILTGKRGMGKSCALNHAVYHARKRGWICIFIPNGWHHVNGGSFIEPVEDITGIPDLYDNVMMSADLLRQFWYAHNKDLKDISLKFPERVEKYRDSIVEMQEAITRTLGTMKNSGKSFTEVRESVIGDDTFHDEDALDDPIINKQSNFDIETFEIKNLEDLALFGIAFRDYAGSVVLDLIHELRNYKNPEKPILIAIDQYNYWDMPTVYQYGDQLIESKDICVPHALKFLSEKKNSCSKWDNCEDDYVMCIGATSFKYPTNKKKCKKVVSYENSRSSLPLSIHIGGYSHVEYLAAVKYFLSTGRIDHGISNQDILSYRMFCSNSPKTLYGEPSNFFFPLQSDYVSAVFEKITSSGGGGGPHTLRAMMRDQPSHEAMSADQEERKYEAEYEDDLSKCDTDVDLSSSQIVDADNYLTELATEPIRDQLELTDSNPFESRVDDVDVSFGGRYDEILRKSGD